jgi:hypothetical protein
MEIISRETALYHFHAADLNDAVALLRLQSRGFGIEYDLTHNLS